MLQWTARSRSHNPIAEMEFKMPDTKENPLFNEIFSKDVLNLIIGMITFLAMQFHMFVVILINCI